MQWGVRRSLVIFCHDLSVAGLAFVLAFLLRNGVELSSGNLRALEYGTPAFLLIAGASFYATGLHRRIWSYTSIADLISIAVASTWAVLILLLVLFSFDRLSGVPRSIPILLWFILVVMLSGTRLAYRAIQQRRLPAAGARGLRGETPILVYGCGPMTALFLHALESVPRADMRVVGILDETDERCGRHLNGIPVLGHVRDLDRVLVDLALCGIHPARLVVARPATELGDEAWSAIDLARARRGFEIEYLPDLFGLSGTFAPARAALPPAGRVQRARRCRPATRARLARAGARDRTNPRTLGRAGTCAPTRETPDRFPGGADRLPPGQTASIIGAERTRSIV